MERRRIKERTAAGLAAARTSLAATGRTHRGKESLGRPVLCDPLKVVAWRQKANASIRDTSEYFGISERTVKRYCAEARRTKAMSSDDQAYSLLSAP
jgi:putative DNA-invertase from lambdoid prophage Rac